MQHRTLKRYKVPPERREGKTEIKRPGSKFIQEAVREDSGKMANCDNLLPHTHRSSNYIQHNYDLKTSVNATAADREGHIEKGKKGRVTID